MRARLAAPWLTLLALLGGCMPDWDEVWLVKDLRILAVQADPPEVLLTPDSTPVPAVKITPLVVDPRAPEDEIDWNLRACTPEQVTCEKTAQSMLVASGHSRPQEIAVDFVVPPALLAAAVEQDPLHGLNGVPLKLQLDVAGHGSTATAIKRLVYSYQLPAIPGAAAGTLAGSCRPPTADELPCEPGLACSGGTCVSHPNANPTLVGLAADEQPVGASWQLPPAVPVKLLPHAAANDQEPYWVATFTGGTRALTEYLSYAYFVTSGKLSDATTGGEPLLFVTNKKTTDVSSDWTPGDAAGQATLWVVVRDDRGGVGWSVFSAAITPSGS